MHTLTKTIGGVEYHVHHNGDWSGAAEIVVVEPHRPRVTIELPGELLRACGREGAFRDVIAAVEQME